MNKLISLVLLLLICVSGNGQEKLLLETITVPVDYKNPRLGTTNISYETGMPFSRSKPTIFVIADAQQFYVRKGTMAALQASLFDSTFNVVGIIGRNNNDDLKKKLAGNGSNVDWVMAHTIFSWEQYVNDINEVRKKLLGKNGRISLYGQSGGGFLIHQFLTIYGDFIEKVFTGAAVNYYLDAEAGICHDKFWEEITKHSPQFSVRFKELFTRNTIDRGTIAMLFQRQHFFVEPGALVSEREKLLTLLLENDTAAIRLSKDKYQVSNIQKFYASADGIPIKVRLFEFVYPLLKNLVISKDTLRPDIENLYFSSLPLIEAFNANRIRPAEMNFTALHKLKTKIFILAGRWDHTADYRSQIALAAAYPDHLLFIADDNHTFSKLKSKGQYRELILSFFKVAGTQSIKDHLERNFAACRWKE